MLLLETRMLLWQTRMRFQAKKGIKQRTQAKRAVFSLNLSPLSRHILAISFDSWGFI